ncbi:hypothetical protein CMI41_01260 [Candidatus Pacearchaeota archaeon]|nr:hypothetical protein [Candidatus Pacearchaeota archaeon]|tara:strand:- start:17721 stop:18539 length:819 start_codon:yes stop_codon:yes gene_type:complete
MTSKLITNDQFTKFVTQTSYFTKNFPISFVETGSNVYGLSLKINQEFAGIHIENTNDYLQHPDFKINKDIVRLSYDKNYDRVLEDNKNKKFSITSFEIWKFLSLYVKGSIVTYDLLYLSPTYTNSDLNEILPLFRKGISNKIGKSAKTYVLNNWQKDRTDQRKIIMSYYRLLQSIIFLREEEYIVDINTIWEDYLSYSNYPIGRQVFLKYKENNYRKNRLSEKEITGTAKELEFLIDEVNKASITTRLPDNSSKDILSSILELVTSKRIQLT